MLAIDDVGCYGQVFIKPSHNTPIVEIALRVGTTGLSGMNSPDDAALSPVQQIVFGNLHGELCALARRVPGLAASSHNWQPNPA